MIRSVGESELEGRRRVDSFVLLGVVLAYSVVAHAQVTRPTACPEGAALSIAGSVAEVGGAPLGGAEVLLEPGTDYSIIWQTDRTGEFEFSCLPEGPHLLTVSAPGFEPGVFELDLVEDRQLELITLAANSVQSRSSAAPISPPARKSVAILPTGDAQDWEDRYLRVGQVRFECTARTCDPEPSEDRCLAGLARLAQSLPADAVQPTEVTTYGRGHAGAEVEKVICRGIAAQEWHR